MFLVHSHIDRLQLTEPDQVCPDKDPQLHPLPLSSLPLPAVALVLHSHPQLVHLGKVEQDKVDAVNDRARVLALGELASLLAVGKNVPENGNI